MALVEIDHLTKNYRMGEVQVSALRDITLSIEEAAFVSFVGLREAKNHHAEPHRMSGYWISIGNQ